MSTEDIGDTKDALLEAESLTKKVTSPEGELTILDDVSLRIPRGETAAIVGPSGAGKSTLLALLAGLDEPSSGRVLLNGIELTALDEDGRAALRNREVGFIFQSFHLLPSLTALENVLLPLELSGTAKAEERARRALTEVGLEHRLRHYPRQLSGGEKQRVAIARAFVTGPSLLFADEPTGNLDNQTGARILNLLFELNAAAGTTLVVVTHDLDAAARCRHLIELNGGRVVRHERTGETMGGLLEEKRARRGLPS
ncbi:MAG TPA: ABC transporter ATP-binding protein [Gammaproteobacteria bacterium]|nr:ABC transporter ATP-binding protein [Gammaproteobacteria bacterium]